MKIKVLLVMPGKEPQVIKIPSSLKFIKAFIGPNLYTERLEKDIYLLADNNANREDFNRFMKDGGIILGTFMIVSMKNKHLSSLKKKFIRKYTNTFKLRKHKAKIELCKDEYLEEYYSKQKAQKQLNTMLNKEKIFGKVA